MVRAEKEAKILEMKGQATEDETAQALNVSLYTVRRVWGTEDPAPTMEEAAEGHDGPATYTALIASGYVRLMGSFEDQMERYEAKETEDPDNPEWARLNLRTQEAYLAALEGLASITGLGSPMYLGEDGYTYSSEEIKAYTDRGEPPKIRRARESQECLKDVVDLEDLMDIDLEDLIKHLDISEDRRAKILAQIKAEAGS